ncbi:MAG: single-stranded DNA-binding protein [Anaerovoracaceae bacterium]
MNNVSLIGRLTRDPEVRYTQGANLAVASFSIAIDRLPRANEEKKTDFIRIVVFGKQAESCEKFLAKGRLVGVEGRIQTDSYVNKEGQKVFTTDIVANRVQFLEWGDKKEGGAYVPQPQASQLQGQPASQVPAPAAQGQDVPRGFQALDDEEDLPF